MEVDDAVGEGLGGEELEADGAVAGLARIGIVCVCVRGGGRGQFVRGARNAQW